MGVGKRLKQGSAESPLNDCVKGERKKAVLSGYVWLDTVRK